MIKMMDVAQVRSWQTIIQGDADEMGGVDLLEACFLPGSQSEGRSPGYEGGRIRAREEDEIRSRRVDGDDVIVFLSGGPSGRGNRDGAENIHKLNKQSDRSGNGKGQDPRRR